MKGQVQLSIFGALDEYEAAEIPPERCRKGVQAWKIEYAGITNSIRENAPILYYKVRPRRIMFEWDSKLDKYGWNVYWKTIDGKNYWGACNLYHDHEYFAAEPTAADCERYVKAHSRDYAGQEIRPWSCWKHDDD